MDKGNHEQQSWEDGHDGQTPSYGIALGGVWEVKTPNGLLPLGGASLKPLQIRQVRGEKGVVQWAGHADLLRGWIASGTVGLLCSSPGCVVPCLHASSWVCRAYKLEEGAVILVDVPPLRRLFTGDGEQDLQSPSMPVMCKLDKRKLYQHAEGLAPA